MSCCVGNYNLCIQQGATYQRTFIWSTSMCGCGTVGAAPTPVDLTGYVAAMQIRAYAAPSSPILYDAVASGDIALGGITGTITLTIDAEDTESFTWWDGVYDLLLISPAGVVTRLLSGNVEVCAGVTVYNALIVTDSSGNAVTDSSGNTVTSS
jgi:hypothetical protein